MPNAQKSVVQKRRKKEESLSVHVRILDTLDEESTSRIVSDYYNRGWELMGNPVLINTERLPLSGTLDKVRFLFMFRKKPV